MGLRPRLGRSDVASVDYALFATGQNVTTAWKRGDSRAREYVINNNISYNVAVEAADVETSKRRSPIGDNRGPPVVGGPRGGGRW